MTRKHVLVLGASGVVGYAALKRFAAEAGTRVIACSRRPPLDLHGAAFKSVDLLNRADCAAVFGKMTDVSHVVYAAVCEKPGLASGWLDTDYIEANDRMLRNVLNPLLAARASLEHITLLQGAKAYGAHVRSIPTPAREGRDECFDVPNFYWRHEIYVREQQAQGQGWTWTIFRPQIIFGEAIGAAMNFIPAIGVYAAFAKRDGRPLAFPGGTSSVLEAVDADLLADAIVWAGRSQAAANQVFNLTNGDVFVWRNVWPAIADAFGMAAGPNESLSLAAEIPKRAAEWDCLRVEHRLAAPPLKEFLGESLHYADIIMAHGHDGAGKPPSLMSTIRLRQAGYCGAVDTEAMLRRLIRSFQDRGLLPPRD